MAKSGGCAGDRDVLVGELKGFHVTAMKEIPGIVAAINGTDQRREPGSGSNGLAGKELIRSVENGLIAASGFGCVERLIGSLEKRCHVVAGIGIGDTATHRHLDDLIVKDHRLAGNGFEESCGQTLCLLRSESRNEHGELFAAKAAGQIPLAKSIFQFLCNEFERRIPCRMAVGIVELLEVVGVYDQ